jgi:hypothetical protein
MYQRIQALNARKAKLINEAQADIVRINGRLQERLAEIDTKIQVLTLGTEFVRTNKLAATEAEADAIAAEDAAAALLAAQMAEIANATKILAQRKAMVARGESIALPADDTPAGMIALLAQEEAAALAAKGL